MAGVVYVIKISKKHRKTIWRKIQILDTQTLGDLDKIIRESFHYDQHDHLSEFYSGKVWASVGYGDIEPGGMGKGASKRIKDLSIQLGAKFEYVYDFGDSIESKLELIDIKEAEAGMTYPRVSEKNKQRNTYCEKCNLNSKKEIAKYVAYDYEDDSVMHLCQSCTDEISEEMDISEIL
jgi:hypothetical protein